MLRQSTWFDTVTENRVFLPSLPFLASQYSNQQTASHHQPANQMNIKQGEGRAVLVELLAVLSNPIRTEDAGDLITRC